MREAQEFRAGNTLKVGKDLQYVRINGTLVGFLAGGLVYAALRATFGHVG